MASAGPSDRAATKKPALAQAAKPSGSEAAQETTPPKKPRSKANADAQRADGLEQVLDRIQRFYARIDDYQADFVQVYERVALSQVREQRGQLQLRRPGRARWVYTSPAPKQWIINGRRMVVLDPEMEQAFVDDDFESEEVSRSISFLWGKGRLDQTFDASLGDPKALGLADGGTALVLVPKKGATYRKLVLGVNAKTGEVTESILFETAGNRNHFRFRNSKLNQGLSASLFEAKAPDGWEVVRQ